MSETNPAMTIGSPRALSYRSRNSRATSAGAGPTYAYQRPLAMPEPRYVPPHPNRDAYEEDDELERPRLTGDDDNHPNAEKLYADSHSAFNIDPVGPVLGGGVGEETLQEIERQKELEEREKTEKEAMKVEMGKGNRWVGGFVLGMKNMFKPQWGGGRGQQEHQPPRDPYPAFPHAVYQPSSESNADDEEDYDRERGHDPGDVEYHAAGADLRRSGEEDGPAPGLRHRTSYQSLDSPSETAHQTSEWHDDGTTAVEHHMLARYRAYDDQGYPVVPSNIPPPTPMRNIMRIHENNPSNAANFNPSHFASNYSMPQSNYIPANTVGRYTVGSPVLADIKPASDYAKMNIPPSTTASEVSFNTYLSRLRRFGGHISSLPWVAERITIDYYPAGKRGEKELKKEKEKERLKRQDEEKLGPGGLFGDSGPRGGRDRRPIVSWYDRDRIRVPQVNPGEIDLTAGSPPAQLLEPNMAQVVVENIDFAAVPDHGAGTNPYSPLAPALVPNAATGIVNGTSPPTAGMAPPTPAVGAAPLAPGITPEDIAESHTPAQPVYPTLATNASIGHGDLGTGATPGGAPGTTVRLASPPVVTVPTTPYTPHIVNPLPDPSITPGPGYGNGVSSTPINAPSSGPVTISVVPPSSNTTSPPRATATPRMEMPTPTPAMPAPAHSPPRSTRHARSPSVPISPASGLNHLRSPSIPTPGPSHARTPSRAHTKTPSVTGSTSERYARYMPGMAPRPYNPNTPRHYFPANTPAQDTDAVYPTTNPPTRTPVPTAPPTPANAPQGIEAPPMGMRAHSEGGHSTKSGISGVSAKTGRSGRSWVVVNGLASPSSSEGDRERVKQIALQQERQKERLHRAAREARDRRRETRETVPITPVSVNPSTQYATPVVSAYASASEDGHGQAARYGNPNYSYGYGNAAADRKGKGRAASVQTVSDSSSGGHGGSGYDAYRGYYQQAQGGVSPSYPGHSQYMIYANQPGMARQP